MTDGRAEQNVAAFDDVLGGRRPIPMGHWCTFQEIRWSYRRPISYDVFDAAGAHVAVFGPADDVTTSLALVRVGGRVRLTVSATRSGDVVVGDEAGRRIGCIVSRWGLTGMRLDISDGGPLAAVELGWFDRNAMVRDRSGAATARISMSADARFSGAKSLWLFGEASASQVPAALVFAAAPAMVAYRRHRRRSRHD